ncbi:MAG: EI24 domain-containing protein [Rhodoferax sp.]|nr:EI24 domain-containing protein [Rhodoferax sp.]MDP3651106.1 EI24 domain-containing protein [Rhodoferax sp.]
MNLILDSFWRAVAYCMHPRVIILSLLPVILMVGAIGGLGYFYWEPALDQVRAMLESSALLNNAWAWLERAGMGQLKSVLAPMVVIAVVTPVIVMGSLLVVGLLMTPVIVALVAKRRFEGLERRQGASFWGSLGWSLGSTAMALLAMVVSVPLWLVPPLVLVLPPLIWGWLTYRVMAFDALAEHATREERQALIRRHRIALVGMGMLVGYLGAAPSLIWSIGVMTIVMAPILVPISIWVYTLIFAFASLWFAHYCLAALQDLRRERAAVQTVVEPNM